MDDFTFQWDKNKAQLNRRKHKVSFEEATTSFHDSNARFMHDPDHSEDEDRYVLLGMSCSIRLLVIAHCFRENELEIRIISARKATKREEQIYWEFIK